jgi:hypothetical protein
MKFRHFLTQELKTQQQEEKGNKPCRMVAVVVETNSPPQTLSSPTHN